MKKKKHLKSKNLSRSLKQKKNPKGLKKKEIKKK